MATQALWLETRNAKQKRLIDGKIETTLFFSKLPLLYVLYVV